MGFFSFTIQNKSIPNGFSGKPTFTVYMVLPDGRRFREDRYAGYGVFGGKDYYEAVAEINGRKGRDAGCDLAFADPPRPDLRLPRLTEDPDAKWEDLEDPGNCPHQGYFYDDDEDLS
jgi:hypothetical protein